MRLSYILFLTFFIVSCGRDQSDLKFNPPVVTAKPQVQSQESKQSGEQKISDDRVYDILKEKVFDKSCTRCHNPETLQTKGRMDLKDKEVIIREYELILYRMTEAFDKKDKPMPPPSRGGAVDPRLIQLFKTWKENGFKEAPIDATPK